MDYFPIFMNLRGAPVLLVGAGNVAERKARMLLGAGADLRVVARELSPQFRAWERQGRLRLLAPEWHEGALAEVRLVIAATPDRALNRRVHAAAERQRIPVNVVDDPGLCRFITPAVVDRSPVLVAVSSGASSPVLARRIRDWIERLLPPGIGRVARAAGQARERVKRRLAVPLRRRFWEDFLTDERLRSLCLEPVEEIARQIGRQLTEHGGRSRAPEPGRVALVGAGPGRADLLTLRGLQLLGQADVILHDRLVSEEVLDLARRDADRIDVGKRAGNHHRTQRQIHEMMREEVRKGRHVVRLKGGDPFIFGRGGEEIEYLRRHGIAFEVVPGITAASGCAAFSGIPLTHRELAQSLTFVTGHLAHAAGDVAQPAVDWTGIAGPGRTAVVYMGVRRAAAIRRQLLRAGIDGALPVALVVNGTLEHQQVYTGTVESLPALAAQAPKGAPGLLVIGQVAALGVNLGWLHPAVALQPAA
jgi:uroporphyrin-III C-methyltransferase/precorrin-2 dehydrogenase/sirohydrochlorin ferrochelatase